MLSIGFMLLLYYFSLVNISSLLMSRVSSGSLLCPFLIGSQSSFLTRNFQHHTPLFHI